MREFPPQGIVGETYNIGTQKERTVVDVARDIAKIFNLDESKIVNVKDRAFNDRRARRGLTCTETIRTQLS
jgi:dTDP-D-glucose 4,6-dehydratase